MKKHSLKSGEYDGALKPQQTAALKRWKGASDVVLPHTETSHSFKRANERLEWLLQNRGKLRLPEQNERRDLLTLLDTAPRETGQIFLFYLQSADPVHPWLPFIHNFQFLMSAYADAQHKKAQAAAELVAIIAASVSAPAGPYPSPSVPRNWKN